MGLPLVQWLPPRLAYRYARTLRPSKFRAVTYTEFVAEGTGRRNVSLWNRVASSGWAGLEDLTEEAGYGWSFFRDTARCRTPRAVLPLFVVVCATLRAAGLPPSLCLPYLNLLFRKAHPSMVR